MARTKQMVALDIGSCSVRAVWVQLRSGKPVVTRAESFALPLDEDDPHKLISTWLAKVGLAKHFCVAALPGAQTVFQSGRIMPNDPRTPAQVAAMDIAQFSEMAGDEMSYDVFAYEAGHEQGTRRYTMAMARPAAIDQAIREAAANNFRPADLIAAPVALYNALDPFSGGHEEPWCYISIGHLQSEVAIGLPNGLAFARSIAVGGKLFTDAVAQALGLSPVKAEVRKHAECGLRDADNCHEQLRSAADRWVSQFTACMGVYRSQFQDRRFAVSKIVLSGGGAQLKGLKEYLAQKLGIPVITSAELPEIPIHFRSHIGTFDMGYGLAITALRTCVTYLSLLPEDRKNEVIFKEKKPWWLATAVLLLASLGVYSAMGMYTLKRDKEQLDADRKILHDREQVDKRIQNLKALSEQVVTNTVPLGDLLLNGPIAREILTLVSQSLSPADPNNLEKNPGDWITLFCDDRIYNPTEQFREPPKPKPNSNPAAAPAPASAARTPFSLFRTQAASPNAATPPSAANKPASAIKDQLTKKEMLDSISTAFIVEGYTPDPSLRTVEELIARLRTSPHVRNVDLLTDEKVLNPTGVSNPETRVFDTYRRFVIKIEVNRI